MKRCSIELKTGKYIEGYGCVSFARNMGNITNMRNVFWILLQKQN